VEESVQEAFIKLNDEWHKLRDEAVQGWLLRVAHNRILDIVRRPDQRGRSLDRLDFILDEEGPDEVLALHEVDGSQERCAQRCLQRLEAKERSLVERFFLEGKSHPQIAAMDGIEPGANRQRLSVVVTKLRKCAKACMGGPQ
jgi:RNA polymerase sigma factor (sigma-70 family)